MPENKEETQKPQKKHPTSSLKKAPQKKRHPKAPAETEKDVNKKEDTRKCFTSRAYHSAMKAALKTGQSPDEAKEVARAAHRKAAEQCDLQNSSL